jgi:hypothetical protein
MDTGLEEVQDNRYFDWLYLNIQASHTHFMFQGVYLRGSLLPIRIVYKYQYMNYSQILTHGDMVTSRNEPTWQIYYVTEANLFSHLNLGTPILTLSSCTRRCLSLSADEKYCPIRLNLSISISLDCGCSIF